MPRGVWVLGFVSMFMDVSSEMVHSLLPVFLVGTLGASVSLLGLIEGVAEATAQVTKVFSGWLSDRLGKRKLLAVVGYGLAALTKPVFPLAATPFEVLAARFADRIGKGVRGAPRDALIADITPKSARGAAFGLRQSLDTVGAVIGPLLAIGLMILFSDNIRAVFGLAVIPAMVAVVLLALGVEDAKRGPATAAAPIRRDDVAGLGRPFALVVVFGVFLTMARFSEAFLLLRATELGLALTLTPLVLVVMNLVYAAIAAPAGSLSDRTDRRFPLIAGFAALIAADAALALSSSLVGVFAGVVLWGVHMGLTQGVLSALIADAAPARLRGTAFGIFNLATGVTLLASSVVAGLLWDAYGADATFGAGAVFAAVAALGFVFLIRNRAAQSPAQ